MAYWMKWDWEHQCDFCRKRKQCLNKSQFKNTLKKFKEQFEHEPSTENATLTIECNEFSVDQRRYDEFNS